MAGLVSACADESFKMSGQPDHETAKITSQKTASEDQIPEQAIELDPGQIRCLSEKRIIAAGESLELRWELPTNIEGLGNSIIEENVEGSLGPIDTVTGVATYTAPDSIPEEVTISIRGATNHSSSDCMLVLKADDSLGVADDGLIDGLVGNVYEIPVDTLQLPNLNELQAKTSIVAKQLNVAEREFSTGFPGLANLFEWFAIGFKGVLKVPADGNYEFRLNSDDGANLYIDGVKVIDNDGQHQPQAVDGSVFLTKGNHDITVDYFQGPRFIIALELFWRTDANNPFALIPAENLGRKKPAQTTAQLSR